jgi:hypothetical protein
MSGVLLESPRWIFSDTDVEVSSLASDGAHDVGDML